MGMFSWKVLLLPLVFPLPLLSTGGVGSATAEQSWKRKISLEDALFDPPMHQRCRGGFFSGQLLFCPFRFWGIFPRQLLLFSVGVIFEGLFAQHLSIDEF